MTTTAKARNPHRQTDVYEIHDSWPTIGVARCAEGDRGAFDRLAKDLLNMLGIDRDTPVNDPVWRWHRMNPCADGEYRWMLGRPSGPGRGNWMGAEVVLTDAP